MQDPFCQPSQLVAVSTAGTISRSAQSPSPACGAGHRGSFPAPPADTGIPNRVVLAHRHPGGSHEAASCREEGADLSSQTQLVDAPLPGAWGGLPAPAGPPGRSPSPGLRQLPAASWVVPAVRQRVGCMCGTGSLPARVGSPAKGALDGSLKAMRGSQPQGGMWGQIWASSGCSPVSSGTADFGKGLLRG